MAQTGKGRDWSVTLTNLLSQTVQVRFMFVGAQDILVPVTGGEGRLVEAKATLRRK